MTLRGSTKKLVDLRKAPKDIVESVRRSSGLGSRIEALGRVGRKLTGFLRSDALRESK